MLNPIPVPSNDSFYMETEFRVRMTCILEGIGRVNLDRGA